MPTFANQSDYALRCEWGQQGLRAIGPGADLIIIVDVLSYSTTVDVAVSRGALIYPHPWKDATAEARARELDAALSRGRGSGGYSLSPASMQQARAGQKIVLPSPNGAAVSLEAATICPNVVCACYRNAAAVAEYAGQFRTVAVIAAGERWPDGSLRPAIEDIAGAGAVLAHLAGRDSPESSAAIALYQQFSRDLLATLQQCASGRQLIEMGYPQDVQLAAEINVSTCVPILREGCYTRSE